MTDGWTGSGVAVTTGSFAAPTDLAAGSARDIVTASTGFFTDDAITGANKYGNGGTFTETEQAGVTLVGHKVGGVKADADGAKLTYYAMNKTGDTLTLGEAKFVANGTVAKYGSEYDLTAAAINADGLKFTEGQDAMKAGAVMTVVDATGAVKSGGASLVEFAGKTYEVDFTDAIDNTVLTLTGKHTDTLTQDEGKTKLTYTVGDKNVGTATMTGTIAWDTGKAYYENTKYTFSDTSKTDISGVKFTADTDPLNQSMTLITNAAGTVTDGSPEFTVALSNTTLSATAEGNAAIAGGNLKYTVTGVTLDKVTVNEVGNDAVPEGWSVASDVAVDTDSMTVPTDVAAGEEKTILTASGANTFSEENISGSNVYKESEFTVSSEKSSGSSKGVTITGAQGKGVTVGDEGKSLVYKVGKKEVSVIDAGAVEWQKGATLLDGSDAAYDYSKIAALGTEGFDVTYGDGEPEIVAAGDSMTLLKANKTLKDMAEQAKAKDYSFTPVLVIISEPIFRPEDKERIINAINDLEYAVPPRVLFLTDQYEINEAIRNEDKEITLLLGSSNEREIAIEKDIQFILAAFPMNERLIFNRTYAGYRGSLTFTEDIYDNL